SIPRDRALKSWHMATLAVGLHQAAEALGELRRWHSSRPGSTLFVATTVTMATGSDNVSVYVPFFAKTPHQIPLYSATFAFLAAVWCLLGYLLVNHIRFGRHLRGLRHVILPAVMILIGLWV